MDIVKVIKKNISIIIPASIAAAALLLFIPTILIQGKISKKLEASLRLGTDVRTAISSAVPEAQLKYVKEYEEKHQQDANEIQKLAMQTTQRELLSYKIFPEPNETSVQIFNEFGRIYYAAMEKLIKDMNALDAPTDAEIRKDIGEIKNEPAGAKQNTKVESNEKITDLICKKRSEQIPVYANPQVLSGYAFWNNWDYSSVESAVKDCWFCQTAYWIHQDVIDTIKKMNAGHKTVSKSPVKRLLGIRFKSADASSLTAVSGKELPVYTTAKDGILCEPWTGRRSNDQIDVTQFSVAVIIKADDVMKFMNELCSEKTHKFSGYKNELAPQKFKHNQITILQSTIEPVNKENPENKRYLYGQDAIVYLNLVCEYVFNKEGYTAIEPNSVRPDLAQPDSTGAPQPGGQPQMRMRY